MINENDFVLSETRNDDICRYLTPRQKTLRTLVGMAYEQ